MWSIIPWTLITVFMFLPILFMVTWTVGAFIWPLSITIWFTLVTSLLVSIFLLPVILSKVLPEKIDKAEWFLTKPLEKVWYFISLFTTKLLKNRFTSLLTVIVFWFTLFFSFFLVWSWVVKNDFMPQTDKDNIFLNIKYPLWYSLSKNSEATNNILNDIKKYLDNKYEWYIEYVYINIWNIYSSSAVWGASNPTADYQAYLNIKLIDGDDRKISSVDISEDLQDYINSNIKPKYPFVKDIFNVVIWWMAWWKEIWFFITWPNVDEISSYLNVIKKEVEKIEWIYNFSSNYEYTNWKISYFIDSNKVSRSWLPLWSVIQLFASLENSDYIPNWLTLHNFTELSDDAIPLKLYTNYSWNVEDVKIGNNFVSSITKERTLKPELKNIQHIDWQMQLSFEADKKADVPLWAVTAEINRIISENPPPEWLKFRFNSNIEDSASAWADLGKAMWVWLLLMFFILVLKFNNFKFPIIILTSTFLSFIWVVFALMLIWLPLSFPAQLWLFWVIWVWVNNAILFIDWYLWKQWLPLKESLIETIRSRFVPIFLTSSTTIAGLITLALKDELWWGLAIAFIWWLILNVFMILIYIPAILYLVEKK
jgi:HAE1 family hydrophobic/amphiphilic exporter-1